MIKKLFLIISLIPLIILMYFAVQWFINMSGIAMLAVIVIAQMILSVLDKLTGFSISDKKSDGTTFSIFTTQYFINSMMSVAFGMVLYVIIDLLLSFVLEQENPILTFALTFLIVMGVYLELKRRGQLDFK